MSKLNQMINKKYTLSLFTACIAAAGLLSGCAPLADPELSSRNSADGDHMVGFFITVENEQFDDAWKQYADENGKVYATTNEDTGSFDGNYSFPISGYPYYYELHYKSAENKDSVSNTYIHTNIADVFWDSEQNLTSYPYNNGNPLENSSQTTDIRTYTINAVMHIVYSDFWVDADEPIFIINPVYREADGDYYMTSGDGIYCSHGDDFEVTGSITSGLSETWTPSNYDHEVTSSFTFTCKYHARPTELQILQYSSDDQLLKTDTWAAGKAPSTLKTEDETSYLIIKNIGQNRDGSESVATSICSPEDGEDATFVDDLYEAPDGTVLQNQIEVDW